MIQAPVCKIIDFSTVDGPGCRTAIFFQGCNIKCLYCHNPETQPFISKEEIASGKFSDDEHKNIKYLTVEDVYNKVKKNIHFIRGITTSGGECSLYPEFLKELFALAKKDHLTTLMDSNGMVDYETHEDLMNVTDGVMLDIKSWNKDVYHKLTGADNDIVKKNLAYLNKVGKIEELRIVYVPDYVDIKDCLLGIKEVLQDNIKTTRLKLITFRKNGVKSILSDHPSPTREAMEEISSFASKLGYQNIVLR